MNHVTLSSLQWTVVLPCPVRSISLNSSCFFCTVAPLWLDLADTMHSQWHNGPRGLKSSMEVFTELDSLRPVTSPQLPSCNVKNKSLAWHRELWVSAQVRRFTDRIYFIVRQFYCESIGNIQYAIFSSTNRTACHFCVIFVDQQQKTKSFRTTVGQLRSIKLVLFCWETVGWPA